jgi:hypothetical protein
MIQDYLKDGYSILLVRTQIRGLIEIISEIESMLEVKLPWRRGQWTR